MDYSYYLDIGLRLLIALLLGAVIGVERSGTKHDAGLRTHILVCIGAAGVMAISQTLVLQYSTDISRLGAQVISGIGFLGAGCILVNGNHVKGLTTAAGLWTTACIGLATGMGYYFISITMTLLVLLAMMVLRPLTDRLQKRGERKEYTLLITVKSHKAYKALTEAITEHECELLSMTSVDDDNLKLKISKTTEAAVNALILTLIESEYIKNIEKV